MVYPALLPLTRTPRLPVVDWTDTPADLNGLVRFAERRNLFSAREPSRFKRSRPLDLIYKNSTFLLQNIYIFCTCLRENVEVFPVQPSTTDFCNRGGECFLRGTTWTFKQNGPRFVLHLCLTTHNTHNRQTSMTPVGFEPTISAGDALDRVATWTYQ